METLFVALDYLRKNVDLVARLEKRFPAVVFATTRDRAVDELLCLGDDVAAVIIGIQEVLDREVLDLLANLKVIGFIGVGTDHLDLQAIDERQIKLITAKGANSHSVAEHALAMALAAMKNLPAALDAWSTGRNRFDLGRSPRELRGKTVGTVGGGDSALALHRLLQGFDCRQLYWTPHPDDHPELEAIAGWLPFDELFTECDILSLHIPLTEETRTLIKAQNISSLRPDAVLVNVSRGGLVSDPAVVNAIAEREDLLYAVDDPPGGLVEVLGDRILSTPHMAGITSEALRAMQVTVIDGILGA